jgi:CSLREA domain-containing protein
VTLPLRALGLRGLVLAACALTLALAAPARGATISVTTTADTVDPSPANGFCELPCTLRATDSRAGVLVTARFASRVAARRRQLLRRFPYAALLRVLPARLSLQHLTHTRDRVVNDIGYLMTQGIQVRSTEIDLTRNRVDVYLRHVSKASRRLLRQRYGPAIRAPRRGTA